MAFTYYEVRSMELVHSPFILKYSTDIHPIIKKNPSVQWLSNTFPPTGNRFCSGSQTKFWVVHSISTKNKLVQNLKTWSQFEPWDSCFFLWGHKSVEMKKKWKRINETNICNHNKGLQVINRICHLATIVYFCCAMHSINEPSLITSLVENG